MASAYQPSAWPNIQKRKRPFFDEREILAKRETASPLFEHIFLAPQLVNHLESLENFVVDDDILISSCSSQGCCEVPEVREEDQTLEA
ncbi:hypothetical protein AFGD_011592 [Aspergillus flavus]|nr:hypothetical protein NYO67_8675 [Aspergillus flavus]RAQ50222.1 hypothetical protein AFGD_011592 [Aspergillus flavus]